MTDSTSVNLFKLLAGALALQPERHVILTDIANFPTDLYIAQGLIELLDGKHFPLRFIGYEKDGTTENGRVEVTKIDKKALGDDKFTYPPTYKVIDLSAMMQGLGGIPHGMPHAMPGIPPGMPHAH